MKNRLFTQEGLLFALLTLIGAFAITRGLVARPSYTDAFYHFNAAHRFVSGQGLTDAYLWTYISAPNSLPAPSHLYWMPFTSFMAAVGMRLFNAPDDYYAAQLPFTLAFALTACIGFWLGDRLGGIRRHAWVAGLVTLFSGFFTRYWGATDTFSPYALTGSLCLVCMGISAQNAAKPKVQKVWFTFAGVFIGLAHLTRADGVLLLLVAWVVILWPFERENSQPQDFKSKGFNLLITTLAYILVMLPWFLRNMNAIGTILPVGGVQSMWYTSYDQLFDYPPDATPQTLFANGLGTFVNSRWLALTNNLGTLLAVEGLVIMTPLMLVGLWYRRRAAFLRGFWLYALGLHLTMTLVFPFPGYRGGLFHSAAALIPFWAALGVVGLDDVVDWIARCRRTWKPAQAKRVFSVGLVGLAALLSISVAANGRVGIGVPQLYSELVETLPANARIMVNDPAQLYYFTGIGGVVLPNEDPSVLLEIARKYDITHLLLEYSTFQGERILQVPEKFLPIGLSIPYFLRPIPLQSANVRLYAIRP